MLHGCLGKDFNGKTMIIDATNETIEILLGATVASQQATFMCSYNEISSTTLTPYQNNGTTNNSTAVTLMGSPSLGNQRQLREVCVTNNDTAAISVTIRYNNTSVTRTLFFAVLQTNESLIFDLENGWSIFDTFGQKKIDGIHLVNNGSIKLPDLTAPLANITSVSTIASTNIPAIYLGKADRAYSAVTVSYRVTTLAASITWAELAIYKVAQPMGVGTQQQHLRLGFTNTAAIWNSTGQKATTVTLTGCKEGDDLYAVFGNVATTSAVFRSTNQADPLSSIVRIINTTGGATWRPSTTEQYLATSFSNAIAGILIAWQGT